MNDVQSQRIKERRTLLLKFLAQEKELIRQLAPAEKAEDAAMKRLGLARLDGGDVRKAKLDLLSAQADVAAIEEALKILVERRTAAEEALQDAERDELSRQLRAGMATAKSLVPEVLAAFADAAQKLAQYWAIGCALEQLSARAGRPGTQPIPLEGAQAWLSFDYDQPGVLGALASHGVRVQQIDIDRTRLPSFDSSTGTFSSTMADDDDDGDAPDDPGVSIVAEAVPAGSDLQ
jgi:hypothetical protein